MTDVVTAETLLRLVQSVPSTKAEPIKPVRTFIPGSVGGGGVPRLPDYVLFFVKSQKITWRKNHYSLTQFRREMHMIPGNYAYRSCRYGDFQEWLIVNIGKRSGKRGGGNGNAAMFNMIKECCYLVLVKFELGAIEYFLIFSQYAGIKGKGQFTG